MAELPLLALVLLGLGGLAVGPFLNQVVVRMPDDQPLLSPPPHCPGCQTRLRPSEMVPVVSWVLLRARCRGCDAPIPAGYPLVELANGVLWVLAGLRFGASWALVPMLLLMSTLLVQSVIDLELYRLLDRITFPVLGVSVVLIGAVSIVEGDAGRIRLALVGALGSFLFLGLPALIMPRGMGLGDVKLALLLGLHLGWIHPLLILFSLVIACLLGVVVGLGVLVARRGESQPFPFGPWLALGCVVAIFCSGPLLDVYDATAPAFLAGP